MNCRNCGSVVNENERFCRECGAAVEINSPKMNRNNSNYSGTNGVLVAVIAIAMVVIVALVAFIIFGNQEKTEPSRQEVEVAEEAMEEAIEDFDYVFPESDSTYMTKADLAGKSMEEIALIRNEIYARHGYIFTTSPYKEYFGEKSWYKPSKNFDESDFNAYEKANVELIIEYEKEKGSRTNSEANQSYSNDYIFPSSISRYMTTGDLVGRSKSELALIRNEIYARRGYIFTTSPYKEYFNAKSWYTPDKNFSDSKFNKYERANIELIKEYENGGYTSSQSSYSGNSGYVFYGSNTGYMTRSDLVGRSKSEVALIRNEIYARRGYIFTTSPYKEYFNAKSWYIPNKNFSESMFNKYEKANKDLIISYEIEKGWR